MRITGGSFKNRRLAPLGGLKIRPTSDKVREAIFSIIGQDMGSCNALDLFAGTGCLGLEALSRNATKVLFIDSSPQAIQLIKKNLERCGCQNRAMVVRRDLSRPASMENLPMIGPFNLVFMDPPYRKGYIPSILRTLSVKMSLSPLAKVVAESSNLDRLPDRAENLKKRFSRLYGETRITIYSFEEQS